MNIWKNRTDELKECRTRVRLLYLLLILFHIYDDDVDWAEQLHANIGRCVRALSFEHVSI